MEVSQIWHAEEARMQDSPGGGRFSK